MLVVEPVDTRTVMYAGGNSAVYALTVRMLMTAMYVSHHYATTSLYVRCTAIPQFLVWCVHLAVLDRCA